MIRKREIMIFENEEWSKKVALVLMEAVRESIDKKNECSVMLTGGRGAEMIYCEWSPMLYKVNERIDFYFGDERCVPPDDIESNYHLALRSLFTYGIPQNFHVNRIKGELPSKEEAIFYASILPETIDIMLLSMGEDGHIASLFPGDAAVLDETNKAIAVIAVKESRSRITVTSSVISSAQKIFCFVNGKQKGKMLRSVFTDVYDIGTIPARLVSNGIWLLDRSAAEEMGGNITTQQ